MTTQANAIKEEFIIYISRERRACHAMLGHMGKEQGMPGGRRGEKGDHGPEPLLGFPWEGMGESG